MNNETWLFMPVVNPEMCARHIGAWKDAGYKIALLQDRVHFDVPEADVILRPWKEYIGYAASVNFMVNAVNPHACGLYVYAGEDMRPDEKHTLGEIRDMFFDKFDDGFGVMQPTGDDLDGTDRICGSPFVGAPFARQWNHGLGTFWPGYNHYFADEELFNTAGSHGLLWQNPELTHYHDHWTRPGNEKPAHHSPLHERWDHDKALFHFRKKKGFPGHMPFAHATAARARTP